MGSLHKDVELNYNTLTRNKLLLEVPKKIIFIPHEEVLFFAADGMYTKIYFKNNRTKVISKPLACFVTQLNTKSLFFKPHRSYLVNLDKIKEFSRKDGYHLIMENNKTIPIAKDKIEEFLKIVREIF